SKALDFGEILLILKQEVADFKFRVTYESGWFVFMLQSQFVIPYKISLGILCHVPTNFVEHHVHFVKQPILFIVRHLSYILNDKLDIIYESMNANNNVVGKNPIKSFNFPKTPYLGGIPNGLSQVKTIIIKGLILADRDKKFQVDLCTGFRIDNVVASSSTLSAECDNIALNLQVNFSSENCISAGTRFQNQWICRETDLPNPLKLGGYLNLKIVIHLNGNHFVDYSHRVRSSAVKVLQVKGCLQMDSIEYFQDFLF
uniref:Galectin n=1 Tax=Romanomermis culicivorax TaxID=13658 RepID=A0A915J3F8_ROMCU